MRVTTAAAAALTVALAGSLVLGASGSAAADGHAPAAAVPCADTAGALRQPDAESTTQQFQLVERLGQLVELTGTLGRLAHDEHTHPLLLRAVRHRVEEQLQRVGTALGRARTAKTLPAPARSGTRTVPFADAARAFRRSADAVVAVDRTDAAARTAASGSLLGDLAEVGAAAMAEAGMPVRRVRTLPAPAGAVRTDPAGPGSAPVGFRLGNPGRFAGFHDAFAGRAPGTAVPADTAGGDGAAAAAARVVEAVGGLVGDVARARDGGLTRAETNAHTMELDRAAAALDGRTSAASPSRAAAVAALESRAAGLLRADAATGTGHPRTGTGELMRSAVRFLDAMTPAP